MPEDDDGVCDAAAFDGPGGSGAQNVSELGGHHAVDQRAEVVADSARMHPSQGGELGHAGVVDKDGAEEGGVGGGEGLGAGEDFVAEGTGAASAEVGGAPVLNRVWDVTRRVEPAGADDDARPMGVGVGIRVVEGWRGCADETIGVEHVHLQRNPRTGSDRSVRGWRFLPREQIPRVGRSFTVLHSLHGECPGVTTNRRTNMVHTSSERICSSTFLLPNAGCNNGG